MASVICQIRSKMKEQRLSFFKFVLYSFSKGGEDGDHF